MGCESVINPTPTSVGVPGSVFEREEMQEKKLVIENKAGLHARPAALFVQMANKFESQIKVAKEDREVDGKSIMGIMMLAAGKGTQIKVTATGIDEKAALERLEELINSKFGEE